MKTKFLFKSVLVALFATASIAWTSCSKYDDSIADLQEQIDANSERIQANEDAIEDIQALVDGGAVITNVEVTSEGVVVTLSDGSKFTVYNGEDGEKGDPGDPGVDGDPGVAGDPGKDGIDADVWTIGADGYWYCNGVVTEWKAVGDKGDKGDPGAPGANGSDGVDANYWTPVYDADSKSWSWIEYDSEGVATGSTVDMDSTPAAVYSDSELTITVDGETYVISLVSDLKTLAFIPDAIDNGMGKITVETVYGYKYSGTMIVPTFARSANFDVAYRTISKVDPTLYDWNFISRDVEMTRATGDSDGFITINTKEDAEGNKVELITSNADNVSINAYFSGAIKWAYTNNVENDGKENIIALSATKESDDPYTNQAIVSDYQVVAENAHTDFSICDVVANCDYKEDKVKTEYPTDLDAAEDVATADRVKLYFKGSLDLSKIVSTWTSDLKKEIEDFDVNVDYNFSVSDVTGDDEVTKQNAYVKIEENAAGDFILSRKDDYVTSCIGKEPIVYVSATYTESDQNDKLYFAEAYIPVVIVDEEPVIVPVRPNFTYDVKEDPYVYTYRDLKNSANAADNVAITWDEMSKMYDAISAGSEGDLEYTELNFTQVMFENNYDVSSITATYDNSAVPTVYQYQGDPYSAAVMNDLVGNQANYHAIYVTADVTPSSDGIVGTQNAAIGYQVTNAALVGDTYVVSVEFALNNTEYNNTELPATITVSFEVEVTETVPTLDYNENIMYTENGVDMGDCWGKYVAPTYKMQQSVKELFLNDTYLYEYEDVYEPNNYTALDFSVVSSTGDKYFVDTDITSTERSYLTQEVLLKANMRMEKTEEKATLQANYSLFNGQVLPGQEFTINFMNPFVIDIAQVELYHSPEGDTDNTDKKLVDLKVRTVKPGLDVEGIVVLENHSSSDVEAAELRFTDATYKGANVFNYTTSSFVVTYDSEQNGLTPADGAVFGDNLTIGHPREFITITNLNPSSNYNCAFISWTYQGGLYTKDMYASEDVTIVIGDDFKYTETVSIRVNNNNNQ